MLFGPGTFETPLKLKKGASSRFPVLVRDFKESEVSMSDICICARDSFLGVV